LTLKYPGKPIEVFATDEHRIGLKPILRRVWAPIGERPLALGHHRFEWLYVTVFVQPTRGETVWYLSNAINKALFEQVLATFAAEARAGTERIIVLVLDNAGWHGEAGLTVPEGMELLHLPPYSPELQPAETLWTLVDEPLVNRHFDSLAEIDRIVAARTLELDQDRATIGGRAGFHWWPKPTSAN
jgi:transposase